MNWFSWLSKTGLDPIYVYEYGVVFAQNELEEDDVPYFNHEFLQSMGISTAKHRLEILKVARKVNVSNSRPLSRIMVVIRRTRGLISKYLARWMHRRHESILAIVPRHNNHSGRWRNAMVKRSKRLAMTDRAIVSSPFLITNGSSCKLLSSPKIDGFWGPLLDEIERDSRREDEDDMKSCDQKGDGDINDEDSSCWSSSIEEIRWDKMFDNLKPT